MKRKMTSLLLVVLGLALLGAGMRTLYGSSTSTTGGRRTSPNWTNVNPPPSTPDFRTPYRP